MFGANCGMVGDVQDVLFQETGTQGVHDVRLSTLKRSKVLTGVCLHGICILHVLREKLG